MARLRSLLQERGTSGTTADAVYKVIRQSIINGDLPPGERLRSDALANKIKVSRTPVREALRKLESEGLVTQSGRTGLVVRELTEQDLTEVFYVREALEGMAARLAAQNATPSEIAELRELLEDMESASKRGDVSVLRNLTGEFHTLVCSASHNNRLLHSLTVLLDHVRQDQTSTLYNKGRPADAIKEHKKLLTAIESRDADGAERAAREHRRKTLELRKDLRREQLRKIRSETDKLVKL